MKDITEDVNSITYKICMKAREEQDEFIFKTILPFCEDTMRMEITKEDLIDALRKRIPMQPIVDEANAWNNFRTQRYCGRCKGKITKNDWYCRRCGQAIGASQK